MSAADAARIGTGLAFVVMPLVFVFAFATHPDLPRPRVLGPEQLIDRHEEDGCCTPATVS